ncbi:MAG: TetR/AcrR family transcriptional regulator [Rubrobacteraceae bacterium]
MSTKVSGTKERILEAAEALFSERGFAGTSVRAVTAVAGTNLNAINYHFGSKEELFRAVVRRIMGPVNEEQLQLLDELETGKALGEAPSVEELIGAYISPLADLLERDEERGLVVSRLVARILADAGGSFQRVALAEVEETEARYLRAFARALPHLPEEELWWRFQTTAVVIAFHRVTLLSGSRPPKTYPEMEKGVRTWMTAYLAAALSAPAAR